ncbi:MAG: carboxypeptidase regulatory-like domain-containing protein [bacterium]
MSTYESEDFVRFSLRTAACRLGCIWLMVVLIIMGRSLAQAGSLTASAATGAIQGQIIDQSGRPLANIQVLAVKQPDTASIYGYYGYTPFPYDLSAFPPWMPEELSNDPDPYLYPYGPYSPYGPAADSSPPQVYRTVSKADGTFLLGSLPEGRYRLWAYDLKDQGYAPSIYGLDAPQSAGSLLYAYPSFTSAIQIRVHTGQTAGPFTLSMTPGGKLSGKVIDAATGLPISGARVQTSSQYNYPAFLVLSDSSGNFSFPALPEGEYWLSAMAEGYTSGYSGYILQEDQYQVSAGQTTGGCNLSLKRGGTVSGKITSQADGKPVAGAEVTCFMTGDNPAYVISSPAVSKADGTYRISGLEPGTYVPLVQYAPGFQGAYCPNTQDREQAREVQVESGKETGSANIQLAPIIGRGIIRGRVIDKASGLPVAGIQVSLSKFYDPYDYEAYPVMLPAADAMSLSSYAPYGTVSHISPLSCLPPVDYLRINPVQTDEQGKFAFTGLENGKYELTMYDPQGRYLSGRYPEYPLGYGDALDYLELSEKKTSLEGIEISLKRGGRLEGKVLAGSTPLAGISVRATPANLGFKGAYSYPGVYYVGSGSEDVTDTDGEFIIRGLPEDDYILVAVDQTGTRNFLAAWCQNAGEEKPRTFKVTEGSTTGGMVISMNPGASISGRVVDKAGKPLAGIVMSADLERYPDSDPARPWNYYAFPVNRSVMTAEDGTYTLVGLSEGTYVVRAWDQNQEYLDGCRSGLAVSPPASLSAPDMVLTKSLILSGKVTSRDGKPLAEIMVSATLDDSSDPAGSSGKMPIRTADQTVSSDSCTAYPRYQSQAYTGKDGTYRITGLAAGIYRLEAVDYRNEYLSAQYGTGTSAALVAGAEGEEKTGLDFSLVKGGIIKGTVLDLAAGKPVSGAIVAAQPESGYSYGGGPSDLPAILPIDYYGMSATSGMWPGMIYSSASTDNMGNYTLKGLPDGKYLLFISTPDKNYLSQYYSGADSESTATPIEIRSEQVVENIDFSLAPGIILKGVIRDAATGKPITTGCLVILATGQGADLDSAYTNSSGEYQFKGLQPGTYLVKAADCQYYYGGFYRLPGTDPKTSSPITVSAPGPVEEIDILLQLKASISGRVVDELDKTPLARIIVTAIPRSGKPHATTDYYSFSLYAYYSAYQAITDADGRYTIRGLEEGDYLIMARDSAHVYGQEYYKDVPVNQPDKATAVHVGFSEAKGGIDLELQVGETYSGAAGNSQYPTATSASYGSSAAPGPNYGYSISYLQMIGKSGLYGGIAGYGAGYTGSDAARQAQWNTPQPGTNQYPAQYPILPERLTNAEPPEITSSNSVDRIKAGRTFRYKVEVKNQAADTSLKHSLLLGPEGMDIDPDTGLVQWTPSNSDAGWCIVQVMVDNGNGQVASQSFRLRVEEDRTPPEEVKNLTAVKGDGQVILSWTPPSDRDGDLADQVLYVREGQEYGAGINLGKGASGYTVKNLKNDQPYTFKIVTRDNLENTSSGVTVAATPAKERVADTGASPISSWYSGLASNSYLFSGNAGTAGLWGNPPSLTSSSVYPVWPGSTYTVWGTTLVQSDSLFGSSNPWSSSSWSSPSWSSSLWTGGNLAGTSLYSSSFSTFSPWWSNSPTGSWGGNSGSLWDSDNLNLWVRDPMQPRW